MAVVFTVEDGSVVANANALAALADVNQYWENRGDTSWAGDGADDDAKHVLIIKATAYLVSRYRGRWKGEVVSEGQSLPFPRNYIYTEEKIELAGDAVPAVVIEAVAELSKLAVSDELLAEQERGGRISRVKAGPVDISYEPGSPAGRVFPLVDALLSGILEGNANMMTVVRG